MLLSVNSAKIMMVKALEREYDYREALIYKTNKEINWKEKYNNSLSISRIIEDSLKKHCK